MISQINKQVDFCGYVTGGFVHLDELVRRMPCTVQWVHHLVATDAKNRFALGEDEVGRRTIRTNQGHSIEVCEI